MAALESRRLRQRLSRRRLGVLVLLWVACREARTAAPPVSRGAPGIDIVFEQVVGGNQDLYVIPAEGGVPRRLTDAPALDGLPRWSPDGATVVFSSERTGNYQLFEVPAAGGPARRLRQNAFTEYQADISPDGRRLAFLSNAEGAEQLWVMDRGSGEPQVVVRHGQSSILGNPDWSPDGSQIVFSSNWRIGHQIYVADVASGKDRRLSSLGSGGCEPRFSPDGRKVVYVSRGHMGDKSRLVEHDLESGRETVLVGWPALNYDPVYSPDGRELAFSSNITGEYQIYRQRLADGDAKRLTFGTGPARYPDYRPR